MSIRHEVDRAIHGADEAARFERAAEHPNGCHQRPGANDIEDSLSVVSRTFAGNLRWRARNDRAETILLEHARGGGVVRMGSRPRRCRTGTMGSRSPTGCH